MTALAQHDPGGTAIPIPAGVRVTATYGGRGNCYRYCLEWAWCDFLPVLGVGMMNPSRAGHLTGDRTAAWVYRWAAANGFGRMIIVNGAAYRCADQMRLAEAADIEGPDNAAHILCAGRQAAVMVMAYGQPKVKAARALGPNMARLLRSDRVSLHVWALSRNGVPRHPLYLPNAVQAAVWSGPRP